MRKIVSFLASVAIMMLPLMGYAASQPTFDWSGGPKYSHNIVEGKTFAEMSGKAAHDAYLYGLPVESGPKIVESSISIMYKREKIMNIERGLKGAR